MNSIGILIFVLNFVVSIYCANILVISSFPSVSHTVMLKKLAKDLAQRGHYIDMVSHFPLETPIERYTDISIADKSTLLTNTFTLNGVLFNTTRSLVENIVHRAGLPACKSAFKNPKLQQLKDTTKKYDLFITEYFVTDCMLGWGWYFNVPTILVATSYPLASTVDPFGLPESTAYIPTYSANGFSTEMSLFERILNTWYYIQTKYVINNYMEIVDQLSREFFGPEMPSINDLAYNSSLLFLNTHFSIHFARPLVPNVIEVAGLHIEEPKPLNQYFNNLLGNNTQGVIYFSMGSLLAIESFGTSLLQDMLDAFAQLPYRIIWKAKQENLPKNLNVSKNIFFENWVPQLDLLCDSRIKLFISHGGMMSVQESIYCGVPILGIPLFADQPLNIKHIEDLGCGRTLKELNKSNLLTLIKELLYDSKYTKAAKKVSRDFKDRPMSPKDTAIYWTEYVLRHKGAPKLQSTAKHLAWYQYYLLDVVLIVIGTIFTTIVLLAVCIWRIFLIKTQNAVNNNKKML